MVDAVAVVIWLGVLAYAVFGGADFGSGLWDLVAGRSAEGAPIRKRIDRSIGPVWEANHVWLIFILVYLWTAFPQAFAAMMTALFIPFIGAAVGIIFRGGAFVFRKSSSTVGQARFFGVLFATSSVVTPFFLGAAAGSIASGRVPLTGPVDIWAVWLNPTSLLGGVLAVGTCAWLAAVFLAADSARDDEPALVAWFTTRATGAGILIGVTSLIGIVILGTDAPTLADGLETWAAPLVAVSACGGIGAMWLLRTGRPASARIPATVAVVAIILGWGVGQYPWVLVDEQTLTEAAGSDATMLALLIGFLAAGVTVIPALIWMLRLSSGGKLSELDVREDSSLARLRQAQESTTTVS